MKKVTITEEQAIELIKRLQPLVERESMFLSPDPQTFIDAWGTFDIIRDMCESGMTEERFNAICDENGF